MGVEKKKQNSTKQKTVADKKLQERARDLNVSFLSAPPEGISRDVVRVIPEEVARKYSVAAFAREGKMLKVAMSDPQNIDALNMLRFIAQKDQLDVEIYLSDQKILDAIYKGYSSAEKAVEDVVHSFEADDSADEKRKGKKHASPVRLEQETLQDTPVAKLVQVILRHALSGKASDIHIEPISNSYRVRFRQDGVLHASLTLPLDVGRAVVSRIKILSSLKIDEKRKPQDGRFRIKEEGDAVDFRVSTLPVIEGEKVVMRVLEKDRQTFNLESLGLMGSNYEVFLRRLRDPYGMLLMTGPTGSGKSTTLYAFLKILNKELRNIITLEDPVEYFIPGINQSQVKPEIGYTFASGLRSILRQDPNVIMVGEIRDGETAELAIHASLTGHLVFSTVHTNNAIGAIPRLIDMGIEPFLLSSSLSVVAAQRLVRRVCQKCKAPRKMPARMQQYLESLIREIPREEIQKYGLDPDAPKVFYKGKGCKECGKLGLKGRVAIYELMEVTEQVQEIISEQEGSAIALDKHAKQTKMLSMKEDGLLKALLGLTTIAELERVTEGSLSIGGKIDETFDENFS